MFISYSNVIKTQRNSEDIENDKQLLAGKKKMQNATREKGED